MNTQPVFSNAGYVQPLEIRKGSDLVFSLTLFAGTQAEPLHLSNVAEVKATLKHATLAAQYDFTCTLDADLESGIVNLYLPETITDVLELSSTSKFVKANYNWTADAKMTGTGYIFPICYGPVTVVKGETQWP